jgi:transcriptional regulator with XRE-family HTH domain
MYFKRLKDLRIDNDLTQKELADVFGISQQTLSDYEKGKYDLPNDLLIKYADYFKVSTDYILGRTDTKAINK